MTRVINDIEEARLIIKDLESKLKQYQEKIEILEKRIKELQELCITDALTGIYNWRHFRDRLDYEVARNKRQKHPLSLIFFDVDNLKAYNDKYGHSGGNEILKAIAHIITWSIRKDVDSAYRFGGDEFAIILPETNSKQAVEVVNRIIKKLSESDLCDIILSFGIAELESDIDADTLLKRADEAMYISKQDPNNKIHICPLSDENHLK
ncbi:MAG: GGDEF domain-containing protein [bacterium]